MQEFAGRPCDRNERGDLGPGAAYRVIWIRERGEGDAAVELARGVLFPGPLTHAEACTCMRKAMSYPGRRLVADVIR